MSMSANHAIGGRDSPNFDHEDNEDEFQLSQPQPMQETHQKVSPVKKSLFSDEIDEKSGEKEEEKSDESPNMFRWERSQSMMNLQFVEPAAVVNRTRSPPTVLSAGIYNVSIGLILIAKSLFHHSYHSGTDFNAHIVVWTTTNEQSNCRSCFKSSSRSVSSSRLNYFNEQRSLSSFACVRIACGEKTDSRRHAHAHAIAYSSGRTNEQQL